MKFDLLWLLAILSFFPVVVLRAQTITTIAGTPMTYGFSGAGGPATALVIREPFNVVVENSGNIFFTDPGNNRIWKINTAGIASVYAGTGVFGHTGDGGPATAAQIQSGYWLSVDNLGNLYFSENIGSVRKIDASGIITTIITDAQLGAAASTGDGGPLSAATFVQITRFVPDNKGNFYISDYGACVVRKVNNAGIISTIAGTGALGYSGDGGPATAAQLNRPYGVAFDNAGNIYIPDAGNNRIRKIDAAGTITTVAGKGTVGYSGDGGPAINAEFNGAWQVQFDAKGNMYIDDAANNCVRKVDNTGAISTYAGVGGNGGYGYSGDGGPANAAMMTNVTGIALDNAGNLYLVDQANYIIRKVVNCPLAQIAQHPADKEICAGGNTNFTVAATGSTGYRWQVNSASGWNDLSDGGVYGGTTTDNLAITSAVAGMNTTQYRCSIVNACGTISTVPATLTVNALSSPTVTIATAADAVCAGTTVSFTASTTNGGATPAYQWQVNGRPSGTNTNTYTTSGLNNGDIVSCLLTSNAVCPTPPTVVSNPVTITVNPQLTPAVTIATAAPSICEGSAASFTASPTNGGAAPAYQWLVNGLPTGATGPAYINESLNDGDAISCVMTSDAACLTTPAAVSNTIIEEVKPAVNASVNIAASATTICSGTPVSFTATPVNGGPSPGYKWQVNGKDAGPDKAVFATIGLADGDIVSCILTSSLSCSAPTVSQNKVVMTVNANPTVVLMPDTIIGLGQSVVLEATVTGPVTNYQWTPAAALDNPSAAAPVATPENTTTYQLIVSTDANCTASGKVTVGVNQGLKMPNAFTPNGDGKNDLFRIPPSAPLKINAFTVYDRRGMRVFYTSNSTAGWDGTFGGKPLPVGTYVWMIEYEDLLLKKPAQARGTVILIR